MFLGRNERNLRRSGVYRLWTAFLVATMLLGVVPPAVAAAPAAAPPPAIAATDIRALQDEEQGPKAVMGKPVSPTGVVGRTAYSRTERGADGTLTTTYSQRPMHWSDGSGRWREFRNELKPSQAAGYAAENASNGYRVSFGKPAEIAAGKAVLRMEAEGASVAITAPGARPRGASVQGSSVTFPEVYPGVDARYTVDNERVKEDLVLKAAPPGSSSPVFRFDLALQGMTAHKLPDNSLELKDPSGRAIFRVPAPFMADARGAYSDDVAVTLTQTKGGSRLEIAPDTTWLRDPSRAYPVSVDPTLEKVDLGDNSPSGKDAKIAEAAPTTNYGASADLTVGKDASGRRSDALLGFPEVDGLPQDTTITAAHLYLYAPTGTNGLSVSAYSNRAAWDESAVTWETAPGVGALQSTRGATAPGWTSFFLTGLVRGWVQDSLGNHGVRVRSNGGNGEQVAFASGDAATASQRPYLRVSYVPSSRLGPDGMWEYASQGHGGGNSSSINLTTGNLVFQHSGGAISARGGSVDLAHTYNSQDAYGQDDLYDHQGAVYGEGWQFGHNLRLYQLAEGAIVFKDGSGGATRVYAKNTVSGTTQNYHRPLYYHMSLTKDLANPPADPAKVFTLAPDASRERVYFDLQGKLTRREDGKGNYLTYSYDTLHRLTTITDVAGRRTTLEYNGPGDPGRLSKITDMAGRVSTYGYIGGNLTEIRHGVGTTAEARTNLWYGIGNQLTGVTSPNGQVSAANAMEDRNYFRPRSEEGWDSATTSGWASYGPIPKTSTGGQVSVSHSAGIKFRGWGSLAVSASGLEQQCGSLTCYMPAFGAERTWESPVAWNSTQQELVVYAYTGGAAVQARLELVDSKGRLQAGPEVQVQSGVWTGVRLPQARVTPGYGVKTARVVVTPPGSTSYTGTVYLDELRLRGVVESLTNASPAHPTTTRLGYDWVNKKATAGSLSHTGGYLDTAFEYDRYGLTTKVTEPGDEAATLAYDDEQRLVRATTTEGSMTTVTYHSGSNVPRSTTNTGAGTRAQGVDTTNGETHYTLDERNQKRRTSGQAFVATVYTYDVAGNQTKVRVARFAPNADLDAEPMPAPTEVLKETRYTYDSAGLMTSMTDPNGNVTTFGYQPGTGYLTRVETPAGTGETSRRVTAIALNADGQPARATDPKGQVTTYEYDGLGMLTRINYGMQDGVADSSVGFTLDPHGNPVRMEDAEGRSDQAYDENDQIINLSRTQNGVAKSSTYSYHANGQLASMTTVDRATVTFGYNGVGEWISQTDPRDGNRAITQSYDRNARTATSTFPSGVTQHATQDEAGRARSLTLRDAAGTVLQSYTYDYGLDAGGNPTERYQNGYVLSVTEHDGSKVDYGYDDLGRLVSAVRTGTNPYDLGYTYDANDNRTGVTLNGITVTSRYDAANQLIAQGDVSYNYDRNGSLIGHGGNSLTYDSQNRWTGGIVNGRTISLGYDGTGRRVRRTVGAERTDYWYDRTGLTRETGAADGVYLRDLDGRLLSGQSGSAGTLNYALDRMDSVTALTDASGVLAGAYSYRPYGEPNGAATSAYNPFRYTGTYLDEATGLYQMGARYYQAAAGRFTQQDPLPSTIYDGQRYAYTGGNPTNYIDPTGMWGCDLQVRGPWISYSQWVNARASLTCYPSASWMWLWLSLERSRWWGWQSIGGGPASTTSTYDTHIGLSLRSWCNGTTFTYRVRAHAKATRGSATWEDRPPSRTRRSVPC
jgi:RHS repeat-associated protein